MAVFKSIGVMSGTSLDGVDLAYVEFEERDGKWSFNLGPNQSIPYSEQWRKSLSTLARSSALDFVKTHVIYGKYLGSLIAKFIENDDLKPDVIGVHGHTIFHNPQDGYTSQIGDGAAIAAKCEQLIVCDFRSMDVARGGQGAPLVPIGDQLLFNDYDARLNIGGFANISFQKGGQIVAYDIGPANIILNAITRRMGMEYDDKGLLAKGGNLDASLLKKLESLSYYQQAYPKSLGREWVDEHAAVFASRNIRSQDLLHTLVEHISAIISDELGVLKSGRVLITGGGAFNDYLIERIREKSPLEIVIPHKEIIEMKEAVIFAFLGILRMLNRPNILSAVTGAGLDSIGGAIYDGRI